LLAAIDISNESELRSLEVRVGARDSTPPFRVRAQMSSAAANTWVGPHVIFAVTGNGTGAGGPRLTLIPTFPSFLASSEDNPRDSKTIMKIITHGDGGATWSPPLTAIVDAGWGGVTALDGEAVVPGVTPDPYCQCCHAEDHVLATLFPVH